MAVIATQLLTEGTGSAGSSFNTSSISVSGRKIILVAVGCDNGGGAAPTTTLSGLGLTWTEIQTKTTPGGQRRITLFRALCLTSSSGQITITHSASAGSGTCWSITEISNVSIFGTNGSDAIVQNATNSSDSATSLTATLSSFSSSDNATFGSIFKNGTEVITQGSGFTELGESNTGRTIESEFKNTNDTTVDWSWSTNHAVTAIAVELKYLFLPTTSGFIHISS